MYTYNSLAADSTYYVKVAHTTILPQALQFSSRCSKIFEKLKVLVHQMWYVVLQCIRSKASVLMRQRAATYAWRVTRLHGRCEWTL